MYANYHTHTKRCFHATGKDIDYVNKALANGIKILGFADHGPYPYRRKSHMRMAVFATRNYIKSIRKLAEKYKSEIKILVGFEYEYFPEYEKWLRNFKKKNDIDFMILGQHFIGGEFSGKYTATLTEKDEIIRYKDLLIRGMETGLFAYVCHPDIYMAGYQTFDEIAENVADEICKKAKELDIPLEYNLLGLKRNLADGKEKYPYSKFWERVSLIGNKVIIGVDAHEPERFDQEELYNLAIDNLKKLGITPIEKLEKL